MERYLTVQFAIDNQVTYKIKSGKYRNVKKIKQSFEPKSMTIRQLGRLTKRALKIAPINGEQEESPSVATIADSVWRRIQVC